MFLTADPVDRIKPSSCKFEFHLTSQGWKGKTVFTFFPINTTLNILLLLPLPHPRTKIMLGSPTLPLPHTHPSRCWIKWPSEQQKSMQPFLQIQVVILQVKNKAQEGRHGRKKATHSFRVDITRVIVTHAILVNGQGEGRIHRAPYQCPAGEATSPSSAPSPLPGKPFKALDFRFHRFFFPTSSR